VWLILAGACGPAQILGPRDTGLDGLALTRIDPGLVVPGTTLVVSGHSFVDETLGSARLRLHGAIGATAPTQIDRGFDLRYVSSSRLELDVDAGVIAALGGQLEGTFDGKASVEIGSTVDQRLHATAELPVTLMLAGSLTPSLDAVGDGVSFVNQPVEVDGAGFLLGGGEGETRARLSGCFTPAGQSACGPTVQVEVAAQAQAAFDRTRLVFPYATSISGIGPGNFAGTLTLANVAADGTVTTSAARAISFDIQPPSIFGASTTAASLGQFVVIDGGGFVGGAPDEATLLALSGSFAPDGGGAARPIDLELVPQFVSGPRVRYVLDEGDPLGKLIALRTESGTISGTVKPIVEKGTARVEGTPVPVTLAILPVKQVVYVDFLDSYVASLRKFGLRAADPMVRARVLAVAARDYAGTNMDFRADPPDDFALYEEVDIAGPDPNGLGLLGYDNSPGKDTDNVRLYDRIGGVNATTQEDGFPGFGGVFTEGFFGFSAHPNGLAMPLPDSGGNFDRVFDPFRPDRGGLELTASELAALSPPTLDDGASCPAGDRAGQIACAVFVLGNLVGTTMTHEVGHSLGLANPYGDGFHDPGDLPNRLMEAGGDRPFDERAELQGMGPAVFCDDAFTYLRKLLPSTVTPPAVARPPCD
jgi:hypothetical protein